MPNINVVQVNTSLQAPSPAPANYLPICAIPVDPGVAPFVGPAKQYASTQEMIDDGFLATADAVLSASQIFGQGAFTTTPPTRVVIINRAVAVAQVEEFQVDANADGTYELFISLPLGSAPVLAATFAAVGQSLTQIKDALLISLAAGAFAALVTGASVDADSGSVTTNLVGIPFVLTGTGPAGSADISVTNTTPSAGIYEDLDAAFPAAPFWEVIPDPAESTQVKYECARWAEASAVANSTRRNVTTLQTDDADIQDAVEPNFASTLVLLARTRSFPLRHANAVDKMSAAWFGRYGGQAPGSFAWHFGEQAGTTETTDIIYTQTNGDNFAAQRTAWVERDGPAASAALRTYALGPGAGGFFKVQKQAEDFWWLQTNAAIIAAVAGGLNMDPEGIAALVAEVERVNQILGATNVIDLDQTVVTPVPLENVPAAERAVGDYQTTGGILVETLLIPKLRAVRVSAVFNLA